MAMESVLFLSKVDGKGRGENPPQPLSSTPALIVRVQVYLPIVSPAAKERKKA